MIESSVAGGYWYDLRRFLCIGKVPKEVQEAFEIAMKKCYGRDKDRFKKRAAPCVHEWMIDGDRDVCKKCGTRSHPVI